MEIIDRLAAENARLSLVVSNLKSSNRALFAEKQAQAERIEKLCVENGILWETDRVHTERIAELEKTIGRVSQLMRSDIIPTYDDLEQALHPRKEGKIETENPG